MCYLSLQKGRLILGFVEGVHLFDPHGLFAKTEHKQIRHVIFEAPPAQFNERALRALILEAAKQNEERLARRKPVKH